MNKLISLYDTHNHYNNEEFNNDYKSLIETHKQDKTYINIVGTNLKESIRAIELATLSQYTYAIIGYHPDNHINDLSQAIKELENLYLSNKTKVVAIGECGLDYYYESNPTKQEQEVLFIKQIELAIKYQLPIVLHIRNAHDDAIRILKQYYDKLPVIIIHCFSGNLDQAKAYLSMENCYLSFSGMITFKKNDELRNCALICDIKRMLSETDCPFLSPVPKRGMRNDSNNLIYINKCLADIKNISLEEMNENLLNNAIKVFKINI